MRERKPGVFELRVFIGKDPQTGKNRQISRTFRGGKTSAKKELARLETEVGAGQHRTSAGTYGQLLDAWIETRRASGRSETTLRGYEQVADTWIRPSLGNLPLSKITVHRLDQLYAGVSKAGRSPNTVGHVHAVVRASLNQAVKWGWITTNPAMATTRPHVPEVEHELPNIPELHKILEHADAEDEDLGRLLRVAAAIGARRGELCGLQWPDVDTEHNVIRIRRVVVDVKGEVIIRTTTKAHQHRTISIGTAAVDALETHRAAIEERARDLGCELLKGAFVFSREPDGSAPLRPDWVTGGFKRSAIKAGLVDDNGKVNTHLHHLRHLYATVQLAAGVDVAVVSKHLGHKKISTTTDIYQGAIPGSGADAAAILDGLLGFDRPERGPLEIEGLT